ncbi:MAG: hypothetical protein ACTSXW_05250 [Candidatus Baldrarchaeia archaeon]
MSLDGFLSRKTKPKKGRTKRKEEVLGEIKYKCSCGEISVYPRLMETGGKCPKCGEKLVEFNR